MSRSRDSRSGRREDDADVVYEIATPFATTDAKILLLEKDDEEVEVIVGNIPTPSNCDIDRNYPDLLNDEATMRSHVVAEWIVTETAKHFDDYDWHTSSYKTNNPNYHLQDVYFTCRREEVDDVVLTAKRFLTELEEKTVRHAREFEESFLTAKPSNELS